MASLTTTEVLGFCTSVSQALSAQQAALLAKGLNVTAWITELDGQQAAAATKDSEQETLKTQLKLKTDETVAALDTAYGSASTKLDGAIGVLGKTSETGQQLARLRSDIRRGPNPPSAPPAPNP